MSAPATEALEPIVAAEPSRGASLYRVSFLLVVLGAVATTVAWFVSGWSGIATGYLLAFTFCWSVVLGSLFFVALQHVTSSVWSVVLRRAAEMLAAPMWLIALLFVPLLGLAFLPQGETLFPWTAAHASQDIAPKAPYLDTTFFVVRNVVFFVIWIGFTLLFVRGSLRQDTGEGVERAAGRMRKYSGPFLVIFAFTVTFASFDWLMSLAPRWYSTIFGTYVFSGMTLTGLAAITLAVLWMRARGWLGKDLVRTDHLYNLGGLLFAFTCFWAYIAFSQYMLIWYGNLPDETFYLVVRTRNGWAGVTVLLAFLRFVIPFFLLLPRSAKAEPKPLAVASVLVILGQLVDLYWIIFPTHHVDTQPIGPAVWGPSLLLVGVLGLAWAGFLRRHRVVAVGDPKLEKSRRFHL